MDGWGTILGALGTLPSMGGLGALGAIVFLAVKMVGKGDSRYNDEVARYNKEVAEHEQTQQVLDAERERRRKAEDEVWKLKQMIARQDEQS